MIKKISLIFLLYSIIVSCGVKGDPEYNENYEKKTKKQTFFINKS